MLAENTKLCCMKCMMQYMCFINVYDICNVCACRLICCLAEENKSLTVAGDNKSLTVEDKKSLTAMDKKSLATVGD